jgi:hypothetical protein
MKGMRASEFVIGHCFSDLTASNAQQDSPPVLNLAEHKPGSYALSACRWPLRETPHIPLKRPGEFVVGKDPISQRVSFLFPAWFHRSR